MDETNERKVKDFLSSIKKNKSAAALSTFLQSIHNDVDLLQNLLNIIQDNHASLLSDAICESLFVTFSYGREEGVIFTVQFVPALLWAYYSILSRKVKWNPSKIEGVLLAIYNKVVQDNVEIPYNSSFRIPTISKPSIYHEQLVTSAHTLTENALNNHERADQPIQRSVPTKHLDRILAGFRSLVTKTVLQQYNFYIACYSPLSLVAMCQCILRLSVCGHRTLPDIDYQHITTNELKNLKEYPKINLSGDVMKEMVTSLHFILFNGHYEDVEPVLKVLHTKAQYTLCSSGLINIRALLNLMELSTTQSNDQFCLLSPLDPKKLVYRGRNKPSKSLGPQRSFSSPYPATSKVSSPSSTMSPTILSPGSSTSGERITLLADKQTSYPTVAIEIHDNNDTVDSGRRTKGVVKQIHFDKEAVDANDIGLDYVDDVSKNSSNLKRIENELLEISKTDKTPLMNCDNDSDSSTLNSQKGDVHVTKHIQTLTINTNNEGNEESTM